MGSRIFMNVFSDDAKSDYPELFWLTPRDTKTFQLAMEDWNICRRWRVLFIREKPTAVPTRPFQAKRYAELKTYSGWLSG
jgi:hypothetical protein